MLPLCACVCPSSITQLPLMSNKTSLRIHEVSSVQIGLLAAIIGMKIHVQILANGQRKKKKEKMRIEKKMRMAMIMKAQGIQKKKWHSIRSLSNHCRNNSILWSERIHLKTLHASYTHAQKRRTASVPCIYMPTCVAKV